MYMQTDKYGTMHPTFPWSGRDEFIAHMRSQGGCDHPRGVLDPNEHAINLTDRERDLGHVPRLFNTAPGMTITITFWCIPRAVRRDENAAVWLRSVPFGTPLERDTAYNILARAGAKTFDMRENELEILRRSRREITQLSSQKNTP